MKTLQEKLSKAAYNKEDFVPKVGDIVRFNWKRQEDEFWQFNEYMQGKIDYITNSGVVIDDSFFDYTDDTVDIQPVKSEAEKRRDEQIGTLFDLNYQCSVLSEQLQRENDELREQLKQAQARIGELKSVCQLGIDMFIANDVDVPKTIETMQDAIDKTPTQFLADIEARAVEKAIDAVPPKYLQENDYIERLLKYAQELRR